MKTRYQELCEQYSRYNTGDKLEISPNFYLEVKEVDWSPTTHKFKYRLGLPEVWYDEDTLISSFNKCDNNDTRNI